MENQVVTLANELLEELNWIIRDVAKFDESIFADFGMSGYVMSTSEASPNSYPAGTYVTAKANFQQLCESVPHLSEACVWFISCAYAIVVLHTEDQGHSHDTLISMRYLMEASKMLGRALAIVKGPFHVWDIKDHFTKLARTGQSSGGKVSSVVLHAVGAEMKEMAREKALKFPNMEPIEQARKVIGFIPEHLKNHFSDPVGVITRMLKNEAEKAQAQKN